MDIFFTSDLHFGHKNLLKMGKGRPFSSIEEHDQLLIENWNNVVKKGDLVYILGDVSLGCDLEKLCEYFKMLNGAKHLIVGNHDRKKEMATLLNKNLLQSMRDYYELKYVVPINNKPYKFVLSHYPILEFNNSYRKNWSIHLYGHIHDTANYDNLYKKLGFAAAHIGVDTSDKYPNTKKFAPINVEDILLWYKNFYEIS